MYGPILLPPVRGLLLFSLVHWSSLTLNPGPCLCTCISSGPILSPGLALSSLVSLSNQPSHLWSRCARPQSVHPSSHSKTALFFFIYSLYFSTSNLVHQPFAHSISCPWQFSFTTRPVENDWHCITDRLLSVRLGPRPPVISTRKLLPSCTRPSSPSSSPCLSQLSSPDRPTSSPPGGLCPRVRNNGILIVKRRRRPLQGGEEDWRGFLWCYL